MSKTDAEKAAQKRKTDAARQARHRARRKAAGVELVALTPEDRRALELGRSVLAAGGQMPPQAAPALDLLDQEALALGRRVLSLGPVKSALVRRILG